MTDTREAIIARLLTICETAGQGFAVFRNRTAIAEDQRPCIVVLDGDEASEDNPSQRYGRHPVRVTMTPSLYLLASDDAEDVGTVINGLRAQIVWAITSDPVLRDYSLNNSGVHYLGMTTVVEAGRKVSGAAELRFGVTYLMRPDDLAQA